MNAVPAEARQSKPCPRIKRDRTPDACRPPADLELRSECGGMELQPRILKKAQGRRAPGVITCLCRGLLQDIEESL